MILEMVLEIFLTFDLSTLTIFTVHDHHLYSLLKYNTKHIITCTFVYICMGMSIQVIHTYIHLHSLCTVYVCICACTRRLTNATARTCHSRGIFHDAYILYQYFFSPYTGHQYLWLSGPFCVFCLHPVPVKT